MIVHNKRAPDHKSPPLPSINADNVSHKITIRIAAAVRCARPLPEIIYNLFSAADAAVVLLRAHVVTWKWMTRNCGCSTQRRRAQPLISDFTFARVLHFRAAGDATAKGASHRLVAGMNVSLCQVFCILHV